MKSEEELVIGAWYTHDQYPNSLFQVWRGEHGNGPWRMLRYDFVDGELVPHRGIRGNMLIDNFDLSEMAPSNLLAEDGDA